MEKRHQGTVLTLFERIARLPVYASDLKANFEALVVRREQQPEALTANLCWGTLVAAAMVSGSAELTRAVVADAVGQMTPEALDAAKTAAAMMTLTNNFYRHHALTGDAELKEMRGGLRQDRLRGLERGDGIEFKLWCVAVSVLNACPDCVQANERGAIEAGATPGQIAGVLRLGALVRALAVVIETEQALGTGD